MGQYDNFWDDKGTGNVAKPAKGEATLGTVAKALSTTQGALLRSPEVAQSNKYEDFWNQAEDIASGKPKEQGGILGKIGGAALGVLKVGTDVLGAPAQVYASGAKELSDLTKGKMPSPKDFFNQATTRGYRMSSWNPSTTGIGWLDTTLDLTQDIVTDPLTWVGFGAGGVAGKGGRTALATLAGEVNGTKLATGAKELFTIKEINDIGRLGQFAKLSKEQQNALNIQHGLRYQFGKQNLVFKPNTILGKVSAETAKIVGGTATKGRAAIGDVVFNKRLRPFITPKSMRVVADIGRKDTDLETLLPRIMAHTAGTHERAVQKLFFNLEQGAGKELNDNVVNSPYRETVYQVMDGTRVATDADEQALADALTAYRDGVHLSANDTVREFNGRRGVNAREIPKIDNYGINRSLTEDASNWVNSSEGAANKSASQIAQLTDMTKQEFVSGPNITRMRTLGARDAEGNLVQKTFLGKELVDGSIDDVNRISEEVLGFKWFKTDAADLMQDYTHSASKFAGRIAFVDRLLDFSPDAVDRLLYKIIPTEGVEDVRKVIDALTGVRQGISDSLDALDSAGLSILDGTLAEAERAFAGGVATSAQIQGARRSIQRKIITVDKALAKAEARAGASTGAIRESYEAVLGPLRDRVNQLRQAMGSEQQILDSAMEVLAPIHMKLMPNLPVPTSVDEVAEAIRNFHANRVGAVAQDVAEGKVPKSILSGVKSQQTKAEKALAKTIDSSIDDVSSIKLPSGEDYSYAAAIDDLRKTNAEIASLEKKMTDEISAETPDSTKLIQKRTELVTALDNNTAMKLEQKQWETEVRPQLEASINELRATKGVADVATMKFNEVSAETFEEAIGKARAKTGRNGRPVGLTVYQYPLEKYKTMRTFLSEDGLTGYAIKEDGDFVSLFNVGAKGAGEQAILDGVWVNGALKLDAFAQVTEDYPKGFLNTKYQDFGFKEVKRAKWDAEYAPDGWNEAIDGTPDIVYMQVNEGTLRNVESTARTTGTKPSTGASTVSGTTSATGEGLPVGVQGGVGTGVADATVSSTGAKGRRVADQYTSDWLNKTDALFKQINDPSILTDEQRAAWDKVFTLNQAGEKKLADIESQLGFNTQINKLLSPPSGSFYYNELPPSFYGNIVKDVKEGWVALESLGIQMPKDVSTMLFGKIDSLGTKTGQAKFFQFFRQWNQFFRVTAMLSPGFMVRNGYTGAFNNFVYGCTFKDTAEAIKFATVLERRGLDAALNSLEGVSREMAELSYKGVLGSGAGQTLSIVQPMVDTAKTNRVMNNRVVKAWSNGNENLEVALRMSMALRGAKNGLNLDQIVSDISRFHFNYEDLSKLDEYAKLFIPFWTFASKNIGLQFVNQLSRPSLYRSYEKLKESMPVDENLIMPEWLARREPLGLTSGVVLNPDLPQVDMAEQFRQFSDPLRLLGQAYPQYRLIPELAGNRMYGTGVPFSSKTQAIRGPLDYPSALLGMLTGQTVDTARGKELTAKGAYVLPQMLPTLGTLQRLLPQLGGQAKYTERQGSSIAGFTGLPIRGVSPEEQERALTAREIALQNFLNDLRRRGYVG